MRISFAVSLLLLLSPVVTSLSCIAHSDVVARDVGTVASADDEFGIQDLEKRRGGGGSGGRGGDGSSSGGGGGGRSGGSGSSSSSGGRGGSSASSNVGGSTKAGSGTARTYGGGSYYAGGARVPYTAGAISPLGVTPFLLPLGALAFFPGLWHYGAYGYPYSLPYHYSYPTNSTNATLPVTCLCQQYSVCGCDNNGNSTYLNSVLGDTPKNTSVVNIATVNGTQTTFINGTLANGTTAADPSFSATSDVENMRLSGYWAIATLVAAAVWVV